MEGLCAVHHGRIRSKLGVVGLDVPPNSVFPAASTGGTVAFRQNDSLWSHAIDHGVADILRRGQ